MHAGIGLAGLGRGGAEATLKEIMHPFAPRFASSATAWLPVSALMVVPTAPSLSRAPARSALALIGGRELRFGGYGFPISDEGSGADIGLQAIKLALRAAEERGETSPLLEEVLGFFDHDPCQAVACVPTGDCDRLCDLRAVSTAASPSEGDPVGRRIVERAADELGDLLDMFLRKGIDRLSLVGGLSEPMAAWLTPDLRDRLKSPDNDAVAGALLVARGPFKPGAATVGGESVPEFRASNP